MSEQLDHIVSTFVDIANAPSGLTMDDISLQALLICCDAARLAHGVLVELTANGDEYEVTSTRADLARLYDDSGPLLPTAWTVIESGRRSSNRIDFDELPSGETAMVLRLIAAKSMHTYPLRRKGVVVGSLVLFDRGSVPHEDALAVYLQGVADATIAVVEGERRLAKAVDMVSQLSAALESRVLIEQAKGIIAERYSMNQTQAFSWLRSLARNGRSGIREVAARIVQSTFEDRGDSAEGDGAEHTQIERRHGAFL